MEIFRKGLAKEYDKTVSEIILTDMKGKKENSSTEKCKKRLPTKYANKRQQLNMPKKFVYITDAGASIQY